MAVKCPMIKGVNMISAKEAKFRSANGKEVKKFEEEFEEAINKAIEEGEFCCWTQIPSNTTTEVRDRLKEDMEKLGYKITMEDSRGSNAPAEQSPWWNTVTLKWD